MVTLRPKDVTLRRIDLPDFGVPAERPTIPTAEYEDRARALRQQVATDWVAVYGDREHAANLLWSCGFDPRFEEALLLLGPADRRVLVVGNEGAIYAEVAGLPAEVALYQGFSLPGQPRDRAPRLPDVLRAAGITPGSRVGLVGWKYLEADETDDPRRPAWVPAAVADAIERAAGHPAEDATAALMHPTRGLRAVNSAAQLAAFEWAATRSSTAILRIVRGARPGMTELETAGLMAHQGEPFTCHPIVAAGKGHINGLRSPSARRLEAGDGITAGLGLWGSLTCRAGLLTDTPDTAFLEDYVRPYFAAIATWHATVGLGVAGGTVHDAVLAALADAPFRPLLNPGHLISYEEWLHSPIRPGSPQPLASGMLLQCDIIPTPLPPGRALNCEDTVALADAALRAQLAAVHPDVWSRIEARRAFATDRLGLTLAPEVLPLSNAPAYLPPFWLDNTLVCAINP